MRGWAGPDVRIKVLAQSGGRTAAEAQARVQGVAVTAAGNALRATLPDQTVEYLVRYEVFVPQRTALVVTSTDGNIRLEDVQARIEFRCGNGNVTLRNLGGQVVGVVVNGDLNITLGGSQWEGEGLDVRTTNGNVRWQVPAGYSAQVRLSTSSGTLSANLPVTQTGSRKEVAATLGQGGALLQASTTNGNLTFRPEGAAPPTRAADEGRATEIERLKSLVPRPAGGPGYRCWRRPGAWPRCRCKSSSLANQRRASCRRSQPRPPRGCRSHPAGRPAARRSGRGLGPGPGEPGAGRADLPRPGLQRLLRPLIQALSDAMNTSAAFQTSPKELDANALVAGEKRRLRGLAAAGIPVPAVPAVPGLPWAGWRCPASALPISGWIRCWPAATARRRWCASWRPAASCATKPRP
ncbi:MAG: DUF4097 family beta strand repeat-containing protein [Hymenobacter sp.]